MIRALSADMELYKLLHKKTVQGYVLSVYDKVVNLIIDGVLIAVCIKETEPIPDALIIDYTESLSSADIRVKDTCTIKDGILYIGSRMVISLSSYVEYVLSHKAMNVNSTLVMEQLLKQSEKLVRTYGKQSPLYKAYFETETADIMTGMFTDCIKEIRCAASRAYMEELIAAMYKMTGLGIGLTPSGDDFIAGMCLMLVNYDTSLEDTLLDRYISNSSSTGIISRRMIINAITNRARLSEKNLVNAYMSQGRDRVKKYIHQVLSFGSSSGTDTMCGMMMGLYVIINFRKEVRA